MKQGRKPRRNAGKITNSLVELMLFLEKNKIFPIGIYYLPDGRETVGIYKQGEYNEVPLIEDLETELGSVSNIFRKVVEWGFPVSAISEKTLHCFEGE